MQYRRLGRSRVELSTVSCGAMQFARADVTQDIVTALLDRAVTLGVNFIETGPRYGDSEEKIGAALAELRLRDRVALSTKASVKVAPDADALKHAVERSLRRMRTDHLEIYHLWFVNTWEEFETLTGAGGTLDAIRRLRDEGVIDHIGISSHARTEEIIRMIETGWFDSVTIYHNAFMTKDRAVLDVAERLDLGVIAMGPLNGGLLGSDSEKLSFLRTDAEASNAQAALRWLLSDPRVTTAIVGFDSVEHVEDAAAVSDMEPMSRQKLAEIAETFETLRRDVEATCTSCGYCKPCPQNVDIPAILRALSRYRVLGTLDHERQQYARMTGGRADLCTHCGECIDKCPQHLPIPGLLELAEQVLASD